MAQRQPLLHGSCQLACLHKPPPHARVCVDEGGEGRLGAPVRRSTSVRLLPACAADPFMWLDAASGTYHAVFHNMGGCAAVGCHAFSADGYTWCTWRRACVPAAAPFHATPPLPPPGPADLRRPGVYPRIHVPRRVCGREQHHARSPGAAAHRLQRRGPARVPLKRRAGGMGRRPLLHAGTAHQCAFPIKGCGPSRHLRVPASVVCVCSVACVCSSPVNSCVQ